MTRPTLVDALESLITQEHGWDFLEDKIIWRDTNTGDPPTRAEINAELKRLQDEYDAQEYARKRQAEYPTIQELVVALYDTDDKADIEAKRAEVKAKYPKPE